MDGIQDTTYNTSPEKQRRIINIQDTTYNTSPEKRKILSIVGHGS